MFNTENAIKYRVTTLMVFAGIILLGLISFSRLPLSLLPDIEFPEITIVTEYKNVSSKEIEHLVSRPIEEAVASVSGAKDITSISSEGVSIVKVKFNWGKNMDFAAMEVREKVDLIKGTLPQDVKKSIVLKYNPSDRPVLSLSVNSSFYNKVALREFVNKEIKPSLERIDGVASANITGGLVREIQVHLDMGRLYANNLSIPEVIDAINLANYNYPAGNLKKDKKEYIIRVMGEFENIDQIKELIVGTGQKGQPVYLRNVADIIDSFKEKTSASHFNGREDINLSLQKEALKNTVDVCAGIKDRIHELNQKFEGKVQLNIIYSQADYIKSSISNLITAAVLGGIIAFFILLVFLKNFKSSSIIIISIPVSIMVVFIFMFIKKISLNMISMGGIAIGIGMLVDNSIVVLESINRKTRSSRTLHQAALSGTMEVKTSVIASTLTSIVVFLPIIFVRGIAGSIFGELAFTISVALASSLFISLSLIPLLSTMDISFLEKFKLGFLNRFDLWYRKFETFYYNLLKQLVPHKRRVILSGPIIILAGILLFLVVKKELLPHVDKNEFRIKIEAPAGTTLENTAKFVTSVEQNLLDHEQDIRSFYTTIGYNEENLILNQTEQMKINKALINVILKKGVKTKAFIEKFKKSRFHEAIKVSYLTTPEIIPGISSSQKKDYLIMITGPELGRLRDKTDDLMRSLEKHPQITDIENESGEPSLEYQLKIDREALSSLGLNIKLVAETLQALIKGKTASFFRVHDDEYDIKVRLREEDRLNQYSLDQMFIKNSVYGINVPLSAFVTLVEDRGESTIFRENQQRVMYISCNSKLSTGRIDHLLKRFEKTGSAEYDVNLTGMDKESRSSIKSLMFAFLLSIIFIYMILASQFESLVKPVLIMFSTPLVITGVGLGLILTGNSINVISAIGLIMLSGIVVNNAIVLFEYFEILRKKKYSLIQAVLEGCRIRLRPIMMTSLTTIFGLIPLAIGLGEGSELQSPMAVSVISGLLFASVLTLIYMPLVYLAVEEKKIKTRG
ncbi:MAG: efflux RND transporter permease subunit [Spirochaetes bacterium]|nr:efflux RND transporter permease subunit [Spirochaetota bacterium]